MARSFNGTSDTIITSAAIPAGLPITIAAWIYPTSIASAQREILLTGDFGLGNFSALEYRPDQASQSIQGNFFQVPVGSAAPTATAPISSANTWYHGCTIAYNTTNFAAFLNGGNKGTSIRTAFNPSGATQSSIGCFVSSGTPGGFFAGRIADVGVWNVGLTDEEVAALAAGVRCYMIRPANLVFYMPLDGLSSPEPDLSGLAKTGTLSGTALAEGPPTTLFTPKFPTLPPLAAPTAAQIYAFDQMAARFSRNITTIGY